MFFKLFKKTKSIDYYIKIIITIIITNYSSG